jgi:hypothetical protein
MQVLYALLEISAMVGDRRFANTALSAFEYERSLFSAEDGNWPDLRRNAAGAEEVGPVFAAWKSVETRNAGLKALYSRVFDASEQPR